MLDEYKELCKRSADLVLSDWEHLSKNELCHLYLQYEDDRQKANAYFSALLYRYWNLIPKYHSMSYNVADPEEVYGWLVDSINYALKHRRWLQEDSHIYKDNNGPDKVINRRMKCARLTYYQFINRKKRKQEFEVLSLDQLQEDFKDNIDLNDSELDLESNSFDLIYYIQSIFNSKDYFLAYLLDIIITENIFDKNPFDNTLNYKKIIKSFKQIDTNYCIRFAKTYHLKSEEVIATLKYFTKNSTNYLKRKIEYYITQLVHNNTFKEVIGC